MDENEIFNSADEEEVKAEEVITDESYEEAEEEGLTPEELELLTKLISKTAFYSPKYKAASKKEFKTMMRSEHVITENDNSAIDTPQTRLKKDLEELNASAQAKRILSGKIIGVRTANPDSKIATALAEVQFGYGTCNVLIPSYLLFNYDIGKYTTAQEQALILRTCNDYIGTEIKFVVRTVEVSKKTAYADRLQALDMEAYANYLKPTSTGKPRVTVGSIVQARVTRMNRKGVTVCALGSESTISSTRDTNEVSWNYIEDCRGLFSLNQIVNCRVLAIKEENVQKFNNNYTIVRTKLSIKQTTHDPMDEIFDSIVEDGHYLATVTAILSNASGVFCKIKSGVDVLVAYPRYGELPERGQERTIKITEKVITPEGKKLLFGNFVAY